MINKIVIFLLLALFLSSCQENKNQEINNFSFEKDSIEKRSLDCMVLKITMI